MEDQLLGTICYLKFTTTVLYEMVRLLRWILIIPPRPSTNRQTMVMMDAKDYVAVEHFDVLLTDLKAENIAQVKIDGI